jgi:hypothetical protein
VIIRGQRAAVDVSSRRTQGLLHALNDPTSKLAALGGDTRTRRERRRHPVMSALMQAAGRTHPAN